MENMKKINLRRQGWLRPLSALSIVGLLLLAFPTASKAQDTPEPTPAPAMPEDSGAMPEPTPAPEPVTDPETTSDEDVSEEAPAEESMPTEAETGTEVDDGATSEPVDAVPAEAAPVEAETQTAPPAAEPVSSPAPANNSPRALW